MTASANYLKVIIKGMLSARKSRRKKEKQSFALISVKLIIRNSKTFLI